MSKNQIFSDYILYYTPYCPFCVRVLQAFSQLSIEMEMRDINNPAFRSELIAGGGKSTVPCLKHPDGRWQYESADIIQYMKNLKSS